MKTDRIKKIGPNLYEFIIECGQDALGNRVRKRVKSRGTKVEAMKKYGEMTEKYYHIGKKIDLKELTFEQLTRIYVEKYCKCNISPITLKKYNQRIKVINSIIGKKKLSKVTSIVLDDMFNKLKIGKNGFPLSDNSVYEYYKIMNSIFNIATNKWEYVKENPMDKITTKPPKRIRGNRHIYDLEETIRLINVLENEHIKYRTLILFALYTQCRRSEIMGIRWRDISFENKKVSISRSLKIVDGKLYEDGTKTLSSVRDIYISNELIELLKEYKVWQDEEIRKAGNKWKNEDRVFTSKLGTYMHPDTCDKILKRIIQKYNLAPITFHALRSTGATLLLANGIDIKSVSQRLGHSTCSLTLDWYIQSYEKSKIECAEKLEKILKKA